MFSVQRWCLLPLGTKYYFDSFGDSSTTQFIASGKVETTGQEQGDYIEVKVLENSSVDPSWIGRKFWVVADAKFDGSEAYQLYLDAGTTGTGMYVKIYAEQPARTVSITVNDGTDPLQSVSVVIGETTKTTGSAGGCTFTLTDGKYEVEASLEGYETETTDIEVAYDSVSFTISLTQA